MFGKAAITLGICPHSSLSCSLLGTLSFTLTSHIHLTILISARWSATSFSFLTGQVLLPCLGWNKMLDTALTVELRWQRLANINFGLQGNVFGIEFQTVLSNNISNNPFTRYNTISSYPQVVMIITRRSPNYFVNGYRCSCVQPNCSNTHQLRHYDRTCKYSLTQLKTHSIWTLSLRWSLAV